MAQDVSLSEAAAALGISTDTVLRRLKAGTLTGEKDARGHWRVLLKAATVLPGTAPQVTAQPPDNAKNTGQSTAHAAPQEVANLRTELVQVRVMLAEVERHRDNLTEDKARLWEELEARRREVAELHVLLQQRQLPPPVAVPLVSSASTAEPPAPRPRRSVQGWRARLVRWLGGEERSSVGESRGRNVK